MIKRLIYFFPILPLMFLLNNGPEPYWKMIQALFFASVTTAIIVQPKIRKVIFYLALGLFLAMVFLYIFRLMWLADLAGSTGLGFVVIVLISYLPELIKKGYVEKI